MEQNPKSVLRGKTPFSLDRPHVTPNDHNNLRVTFAKAPLNNASYGSSTMSVNQSVAGAKTGTPAKPIPRLPFHTGTNPSTKPNLTGNGVGNDSKAKPNNIMGANKPALATAARANARHTENYAPKVAPGTGQGPSTSKRSATTIDTGTADEDKRSEDVSIQARASKSKRRLRKFLRRSSKSFSGLHKSKSGKKLKKKKSAQGEDKLEAEGFQPAAIDAEYASELGKITQILKAVTAFEASTSTENATVPPVSSPRIKITSMVEGGKSGHWGSGISVGHNSMHRPLSSEELKQLLSSITRVVSLHQLPVNEQKEVAPLSPISSVSTKDTSSLSKLSKSKKKMKKKKLPNYMAGTANREAVKTKSIIINTRSARSKSSKRGKKIKNEHRKKDVSDGSSVSSLDKDPIKNAAFLKKYFEESTRLAEKKSSDELIVKGEGIQGVKEAPSNISNSKNKKGKKGTTTPSHIVKGNATTNHPKAFVKNSSKASVSITEAKKKSLASTTSFKRGIQRIGSKMVRDSVEQMKKSVEDKKPPAQNTPPVNVKVESNAQEKSKLQDDSKGKSTASKISTTAVAGSPKANSPVSSQLNAAINALRDRDQITPKTPIIDPTNNAALRQQQFKSIEEVINSKFTGDTAKMKSIWEKTPYQPMTHARFRDMVSRYASPEANAAFAKAEEVSKALNGSVKVPKTITAETTPANLLTLPTQWTIKDRLAEDANNDKPVTLLQGPPMSWQADTSRVTTAYNRMSYSKGNMRKDARQIRRRFNDGANDRPRPTTTKDEYLGGVGGGPGKNINEALNYYKNLFTRNAISK